MQSAHPVNDPAAKPCRHLLSKGMYITGNRDLDPAMGVGDGNCWCALTQHVLGPDDKLVERPKCTEGRGCFVAIL